MREEPYRKEHFPGGPNRPVEPAPKRRIETFRPSFSNLRINDTPSQKKPSTTACFSLTAGAVRHRGDTMQATAEKPNRRRAASRNPTEAAITCQPYASSGAVPVSDGVLRNFSSGGSYIETFCKYNSGTILIVRMVGYPTMPSSRADEERPRSICLAEVKWWQELSGANANRYGLGLKYLD